MINSRESERILRVVLVLVSIVDAHPPLVIVLLVDKDRVGQLLGMVDLFDEPCCE